MTNSIYDGARYRFATGQLDWRAANLRLLAMQGTPNFVAADATVQALITRAISTVFATSQVIPNKSVSSDGYLISDSALFPTPAVSTPITSFIMVLYGVDVPTSIPLLFIDTALNLPFTPNGLDVVVQPDWMQHRAWGRV